MPPRLRSPTCPAQQLSTIVNVRLPILSSPSGSSQCLHKIISTSARPFSSSSARPTKLREAAYRWLSGAGAVFREHKAGSTNYLSQYNREGVRRTKNGSDQAPSLSADPTAPVVERGQYSNSPFLQNAAFRTSPVLDDSAREEIYRRVVTLGNSVRDVSVEMGVEMGRVGAVVRLKTVEKDWLRKGTPLASQYSRAILSMVAVHSYSPPADGSLAPKQLLEPINELPNHPLTNPQIFYPVGESQTFTRKDASRVFSATHGEQLLPTDERIPHRQLIAYQHKRDTGCSAEEYNEFKLAMEQKELEEHAQRIERAKVRRARDVQVILPSAEQTKAKGAARWEWRFEQISIDEAGKDGRGAKGVGARYGIPSQERKKGMIKIPRRV